MASINGVTIKSLKKFIGMEGEAYQGNVYYNGRKLGFWSQDGSGGSDHYSFPISELKKPLEQYKNYLKTTGLSKNHSEGSEDLIDMDDFMLDVFMSEVLGIMEIERQYKLNKRNGFSYTLMVYPVNDFVSLTIKLNGTTVSKQDMQIVEDRVKKGVIQLNPSHKVFKIVSKVIKDPSDLDFVWGEVPLNNKTTAEQKRPTKSNNGYTPIEEVRNSMREIALKEYDSIKSRFDVKIKGSSGVIIDKRTGLSSEVPLCSLNDVVKVLKELFV